MCLHNKNKRVFKDSECSYCKITKRRIEKKGMFGSVLNFILLPFDFFTARISGDLAYFILFNFVLWSSAISLVLYID